MIEDVRDAPDVSFSGDIVPRIAASDFECGDVELRWRAIQFGHAAVLHLHPRVPPLLQELERRPVEVPEFRNRVSFSD